MISKFWFRRFSRFLLKAFHSKLVGTSCTKICKSTLFEKSIFCPKIQFWQNLNIFTSFSSNIFWQFFSWNKNCQQLNSPKPQQFHEFFTWKKKSTFFCGKSKLNFWTKNDDFEQCAHWTNKAFLWHLHYWRLYWLQAWPVLPKLTELSIE